MYQEIQQFVDKLVPAPDDLFKLSDAVKNDAVKKDAYNAKIKDKIPDITNLATNTTLNTTNSTTNLKK